MKHWKWRLRKPWLATMVFILCGFAATALAAPLPGGTLDPLTIPKYVTPLVIPPVMNNNGTADTYDIAVRQFQQQILPGGIWNTVNGRTDTFPATTVWSYGPDADQLPDSSGSLGGALGVAPAPNSQFNYPAYTVENISGKQTTVDWINGLKEKFGAGPNFLPHLVPVDQTLHWANPTAECFSGPARTDCRGQSDALYTGPVPIITHVHGAHVGPESDGYPEAWYLPDPAGSNFLCTTNLAEAGTVDSNTGKTFYMCEGSIANKYGGAANTNAGVARFNYPNDQPSTTLWYHDHSLGITRNNVYAGPAGFWLIREDPSVVPNGETGLMTGTLPGPAPKAGDDLVKTNFPTALGGHRGMYREIPIVIQDRSFDWADANGNTLLTPTGATQAKLFYPANRAFFEGLGTGQTPSTPGNNAAGLNIPFIPTNTSDISPVWNPEAFFNVMVVNGVAWPKLEVAPAMYRLRLLNGCNSRFLNLALFETNKGGQIVKSMELPFYQIGAEQSLLPQVVMVQTGYATPLTTGMAIPTKKKGMLAAASKDQALLMGLAERADVLVDFSGLPNGTRIRMINTAPDAPFGGFPDVAADPGTTGQVMEFVVNNTLLGASPTDPTPTNLMNGTVATAPNMLGLSQVDSVTGYPDNTGGTSSIRDLALIEEESQQVCVSVSPNGTITYIDLQGQSFDPLDPANACFAAGGVPFAPREAVLGYNGSMGAPGPGGTGATPTLWSDPVVTNPAVNATEEWQFWNWTADAHPIHLHLVKFKVLGRTGVVAGTPSIVPNNGVQPWEVGWKDTVISYPGEVTRIAATFDVAGLYVWHCHILEHEDNEMMVPYCVGDKATAPGCKGL